MAIPEQHNLDEPPAQTDPETGGEEGDAAVALEPVVSDTATNAGNKPVTDSASKLQLYQFSDPVEIEALMPVLRAGHEETRYGYLPFSEKKMLHRLHAILQYSENNVGFYVTLENRIVGVMDVGVGEPYLAEGRVIGTCRSLYVLSDVRATLAGGKVALGADTLATEIHLKSARRE